MNIKIRSFLFLAAATQIVCFGSFTASRLDGQDIGGDLPLEDLGIDIISDPILPEDTASVSASQGESDAPVEVNVLPMPADVTTDPASTDRGLHFVNEDLSTAVRRFARLIEQGVLLEVASDVRVTGDYNQYSPLDGLYRMVIDHGLLIGNYGSEILIFEPQTARKVMQIVGIDDAMTSVRGDNADSSQRDHNAMTKPVEILPAMDSNLDNASLYEVTAATDLPKESIRKLESLRKAREKLLKQRRKLAN